MRIKVLGFYKNQFTSGEYLLTDKSDFQALNEMRTHFTGLIYKTRN